jgi:hypothetical protein
MSVFHEDRANSNMDFGKEIYTYFKKDIHARSIEGMKFFTFSYAIHFRLGTQHDDNEKLADELI